MPIKPAITTSSPILAYPKRQDLLPSKSLGIKSTGKVSSPRLTATKNDNIIVGCFQPYHQLPAQGLH